MGSFWEGGYQAACLGGHSQLEDQPPGKYRQGGGRWGVRGGVGRESSLDLST